MVRQPEIGHDRVERGVIRQRKDREFDEAKPHQENSLRRSPCRPSPRPFPLALEKIPTGPQSAEHRLTFAGHALTIRQTGQIFMDFA